MTEILRKLLPACVFVTAVVLVTLFVLTFSPVFAALPLAVLCGVVGHGVLWRQQVRRRAPARAVLDDLPLSPHRGEFTR
ncbi:MAG: hypothetical protein V2J24_00040 [Pseudomonadales bacterium]|nr:hypothetical protein [Pseudomonadales bacterium]